MRDFFSSAAKSTTIEVIATGWQRGINSEVRLAAWIAAMRATPRTSPFFAVPEVTRASVAGRMRVAPPPAPQRGGFEFPAASTNRAGPRSAELGQFFVLNSMD